jgi:hypothetical protein
MKGFSPNLLGGLNRSMVKRGIKLLGQEVRANMEWRGFP